MIRLILALLLLTPSAYAQTFNQCAFPSPDCDNVPLETFSGPPFERGETFETDFDAQGPLPITPGFRCRWNWEAFFPPACVDVISSALQYEELFADVTCTVTTGVTPPSGHPNNTASLFCEVNDPNLADAFPPSFAPTLTDIRHTWEVLDTCALSGEDVVIVGGDTEFYQELIPNQCVLVDGPDPMITDIALTVSEPPTSALLLAGGALLVVLRLRRP